MDDLLQDRNSRCKFILLYVHILIFALLIQSPQAEWPIDSQPYGFLGCKQLRFRGLWEYDIDSSKLDESTDGICITVAVANILLYYRWPPLSRFDGLYVNDSGDALLKSINHRWRYSLITGKRTTLDCESDDPETRHLPHSPSWTGLQELRKLVYVVERSYGCNYEFFKVPDDSICDGTGYYAIEHVLRNRFGYPLCKTIDASEGQSKQKVIRDLKRNIPVIAMTCEHAYLIDGYKYDAKKKRSLIHSSDYLFGEESMGWFPWKYFYRNGLNRFVVNISPRFRLSNGPSTRSITYSWGEGTIPGTKFTSRKGRIVIRRESKAPLGNIELKLEVKHLSDAYKKDNATVLRYKGNISSDTLFFPQRSYFSFNVKDSTNLILHIKNLDPHAKNLRVVLHDFVKRKQVAFNIIH